MASNDNGGSFIVGFLMGGVVGVVVGILLAPKSGTETRAELVEQSEVWRTRAEDIAARLREQVTPTMDTLRERVAPAVEVVRERVGPVAEAVSSRVGRAPEAVEGGDGVGSEEGPVEEGPVKAQAAEANEQA